MKITLEQRLRAAAGPPAYMRRLRRIEDMQAAFLRELEEVYEGAVAELGEPTLAEERLLHRARLLDLPTLNELIERHNRYYPTEANLRMDVRSRTVMDGNEPWQPMPKVTAEDLVKRAVRTA
jgi:hypothetical protein